MFGKETITSRAAVAESPVLQVGSLNRQTYTLDTMASLDRGRDSVREIEMRSFERDDSSTKAFTGAELLLLPIAAKAIPASAVLAVGSIGAFFGALMRRPGTVILGSLLVIVAALSLPLAPMVYPIIYTALATMFGVSFAGLFVGRKR